MNKFAKKLKELREESNLSAMTLGKLIGVSDASIINWENGKNDIKSEYLIRIAKYFKVTTDYLLGLEDY